MPSAWPARRKLTCASNANRVLTDFFTQGRYDTHRPFYKTASPSMDILISSNLERLLFEMADRDCVRCPRGWRPWPGRAATPYPRAPWRAWAIVLRRAAPTTRRPLRPSARCGGSGAMCSIPHTAVGYRVMQRRRPERVQVLLSTASPYKFCADVLRALGERPRGDFLEQAEALHRLTRLAVPQPLAQLKGLAGAPFQRLYPPGHGGQTDGLDHRPGITGARELPAMPAAFC